MNHLLNSRSLWDAEALPSFSEAESIWSEWSSPGGIVCTEVVPKKWIVCHRGGHHNGALAVSILGDDDVAAPGGVFTKFFALDFAEDLVEKISKIIEHR